jgi:hypothetical protein
VGAGFVASLAKPGGNITGITTQQEEVLGKLIGILHEVTPEARRIAIRLNENHPSHAVFWAGAQSACAALGLVALRVVASGPDQRGVHWLGHAEEDDNARGDRLTRLEVASSKGRLLVQQWQESTM